MTDDTTDTDSDTESESDEATAAAYVAENSDASQPPDQLRDSDAVTSGDDAGAGGAPPRTWCCTACGTPVADAHALATHDCPPHEDEA